MDPPLKLILKQNHKILTGVSVYKLRSTIFENNLPSLRAPLSLFSLIRYIRCRQKILDPHVSMAMTLFKEDPQVEKRFVLYHLENYSYYLSFVIT